MRSCDWDCRVCNTQTIFYLALYRTCLVTSVLEDDEVGVITTVPVMSVDCIHTWAWAEGASEQTEIARSGLDVKTTLNIRVQDLGYRQRPSKRSHFRN